jgi:excisionase family DNA binding protein
VCHDDELNLKQVAQVLGVHYMTVYRYVRSGRLPAQRAGSVWMVRRADLVRAGATAAPDHHHHPVAAGPDRVGRLAERLGAGDEQGAWAEVEAALTSGWDPEAALLDLLAPAVRLAGAGDPGSAAHLATTTAQRTSALLAARFRRRGRYRGTVVLGAPTGEGHALAPALLTDLLRLRNLTVSELGVDVPPAAFADAAVRAKRLVAVGVSVTTVARLAAAREVVTAVRAVDPDVPVLVGGQAVRNAEVGSLTGATAWAPDGRAFADLVEGLLPRRRGVPAPVAS